MKSNGKLIVYKVNWFLFSFIIIFVLSFKHSDGLALDINDKLAMDGVLSGAYQYQRISNATEFNNTGGGAVPFQIGISLKATPKDKFFAKFGIAAGNALNDETPFYLSPWAADLEEDVKNINGSNRDYLLTAWYRHTFVFSDKHTLGFTGGIIDATDYLDGNIYANDEYTQFMNSALVNASNGFFPSYAIGSVFEWGINQFMVKGIAMSVNENDDGNAYSYFGVQFAYTKSWGLRNGNYRIILDKTSYDFSNPGETYNESLQGITMSFDQELNEFLGTWARFGWGDDKASVPFSNFYSGGINLDGKIWGRDSDHIGIGYAYQSHGNQVIKTTQVFESYIRIVLNKILAVTADIQYMKDVYKESDGPEGFIFGGRVTAQF